MDDMINRHDSIAEENIEPNGRPAKNQFEEWSSEVTDRADNVFKDDTKDGPIKNRKKRIKEMDEVIKNVVKPLHISKSKKRVTRCRITLLKKWSVSDYSFDHNCFGLILYTIVDQ